MKKHCGHEYPDDFNFCPICREKLSNVCHCWRLGRLYDCGESECPGYYMDDNGKIEKNWREKRDRNYQELKARYASLRPSRQVPPTEKEEFHAQPNRQKQ